MNKKLENFTKRNRKCNAHFYLDGKIEGTDYIVCPVSNERLSRIKSSYIKQVLGMRVEEYDTLYPGIRGVSQARKNSIKKGLHKIDTDTGKTKYQISQEKAKAVLSEFDEHSISGYKRKGQKTRATHMSNIDQFGSNGHRRQVDHRLTTMLDNGLTIVQNAHKKQRETPIRNKKSGTDGASKLSKKVLEPILEFLNSNNIKYYFDDKEYGIKDTDTRNTYFWNLNIPEFKLAIEYQSAAWHADPALSEGQWNKWSPPRGKKKTSAEALEYDYNKARSLFKHRGYVTYYVWQRSQDKDIKDLLCLLKTQTMKY